MVGEMSEENVANPMIDSDMDWEARYLAHCFKDILTECGMDKYHLLKIIRFHPAGYRKIQEGHHFIRTISHNMGANQGVIFSGNNFDDAIYYEAIFNAPAVAQDKAERESYSDEQAVADWSAWITENATSPWFSFIELSTMNHYDDYGAENDAQSPGDSLKLAYARAASAVDQNISKILATLSENELMDDTIILITSNHGTEFNETNSNSWGSNTNYSRYQLQVPLVIHWPGKEAREYTHKSSHFDMSVSLLQELMGVSSDPREFSSGVSLFEETERQWILAGDAREIALITAQNTTVVDKFGNYKVYDNDYRRQKKAKPKLSILMQGLSELKRFYNREH